MEYKITRFEQIGDELFIRIEHKEFPLYVEHHFTEEEKSNLEDTIAKLVAELEIQADNYVPPPPIVSRLDEIESLITDEAKIRSYKEQLLRERESMEGNQTR
ncbi:MAG: hypothetical protein ABIL76_06035 [candidate division WOR-3 bacterium]